MGAHDDAKYILRDPAIERYDDRYLLSSCLLYTTIHLACLTATSRHVQLSLNLSHTPWNWRVEEGWGGLGELCWRGTLSR
jgi:hypothetical protein